MMMKLLHRLQCLRIYGCSELNSWCVKNSKGETCNVIDCCCWFIILFAFFFYVRRINFHYILYWLWLKMLIITYSTFFSEKQVDGLVFFKCYKSALSVFFVNIYINFFSLKFLPREIYLIAVSPVRNNFGFR